LEELGIPMRTALEQMLKKSGGRTLTGLIWLRIGKIGRLFYIW
jgi:hypothetical protein